MTNTLDEIRLRRLSDEEFDEANRSLKEKVKSTTVCPTCRNDTRDLVNQGIVPTYQLFGKTHPCDCKMQLALFRHYTLANIGYKFMILDWSRMYDGSVMARNVVEDYLEHWQGRHTYGLGVTFSGNLGTGKTFALTHLGKELIKRGQTVYFVGFNEMVNCFTWPNAHKFEQKLRDVQFLLLDEVVAPWTINQVDLFASRYEEVIRHRTNHNLPTFLGTNLTFEELEEHYPRIYSLLELQQQKVTITGEDFRKEQTYHEMLMELSFNNEILPIT